MGYQREWEYDDPAYLILIVVFSLWNPSHPCT